MRPRTIASAKSRLKSSLSFLFSVKTLFSLVLAVAALAVARAQTVPAATASSSRLLLSSFPQSSVGRIATNSAGDALFVTYPGYGNSTIYWMPRGTTTPVALATTTGSSSARDPYVDAQNNLYVPNLYGANIVEIPYIHNAYATISSFSTLTACASYAPQVPCLQFLGGASNAGAYGYYMQPLDMGMDAAGNAYVLQTNSNGNCVANCIIKFTPNNDTGKTYAASVLISSLPPNHNERNDHQHAAA